MIVFGRCRETSRRERPVRRPLSSCFAGQWRTSTASTRGRATQGCIVSACTRARLFGDFSRGFRVLVPAVTGVRTLAPGVDVVLEVFRMAVNEQFLSSVPSLYPGSMATDPKPYASLEKMWKAFGDLANNKTPAISSINVLSLPVSSSGVRSSATSGP